MSPLFAKNFIEKQVWLDSLFLVATPTRETLLVKNGYRSCSVTVGEMDTTADFMLLDMTNFDVILGMDWLSFCHIILDCHSKAIKFNMLGEICLRVSRRPKQGTMQSNISNERSTPLTEAL